MATKKATASTSKKKTVAAPAKKKTVVSVKPAASARVTKTVSTREEKLVPDNIMQIVLAEFVGTFLLTALALTSVLFSGLAPILLGLGLVVIALTVIAVSGSHLNPAVTFGLWTMGRLKPIMIPFYWGAQFLGAIAAFLLMTVFGANSGLSLGATFQFSPTIFLLEVVGMTIFMFGIAASVSQDRLPRLAKATGIGLSLLLAVTITMSLIITNNGEVSSKIVASSQVSEGQDTKDLIVVKNVADVPRVLQINGAVMNPAIALVTTEKSKDEIAPQFGVQTDTNVTTGEKAKDSHFTMETLFGALLGAAIGGNLYRLISGNRREL